MRTETHNQELNEIVNWLNEQYPELRLVMYDIGARWGLHYHYKPLVNLSKFIVVGFEPDAQEAVNLKDSISSGFNQVWPFALGESKETRTLFITKEPGCSSFYRPATEAIEEYPPSDYFLVTDTKSVETISLDEFTGKFDVALPDFIKMDIQGAEYEVLKGGESTLKNVVGIFLEAHLREMYVGEPLFPEIHALLTRLGFRLILIENNPHYAGEILEIDVAYVKDTAELETEEQLAKAVLFCLVHRNLEFAAHLVRKSGIPESKKIQILQLLSKPITAPKMMVNSEAIAPDYGV